MKNRLFGVFRRERSEEAPKNAWKRIAAVLLSLCVAASALTVPVYAIPAVIPFLGKLFVEIGVSWILGESAHAILNSNESLNDTQRQQILSSVSDSVSSGALVEFYADDDQKTVFVQPVGGLSGEQAEMAQFIANSVKSDLSKVGVTGQSLGQSVYSSITNNTNLPDAPGKSQLRSESYSLLKTSAMNAMNLYVAKEAYEAKTEQKVESLSELQEVLGDSLPMYNFSFTGPNPTLSYTSPEYTRVSAILKDGFVFTPAAAFTPGQTSFTSEQTEYIASYASRYVHSGGNFIRLNNEHDPLYAFNYYFLTGDGNIYFSSYISYNANGNIPGNSFPLNTTGFYDSSGKYISGSAAKEIASRITSVGAVLNTGNQVPSAIPVNTEAPSESDFTTTAGGEAVSKDIPRSDIENIVGGAIGMGLIGADAPTIGADGTITKADDIPIEKLGAILEAITSGNLNLDSMEEYLSLISTLVANGNLTATEQQRILENIGAFLGAGAADLSAIKDILKEWAKAAEAEAVEENLDFELPDVTIIDKFPFSLPFDVYYIFDLLCTEPKKPIFTFPIKTTLKVGKFSCKVDESFTLDLTALKIGGVDMVRAFINTATIILFSFSLIAGTRKFIWK